MNLLPGVITEYLAEQRRVRVMIPPLTDGASKGLLADVLYSLGDKAKDGAATEVRIKAGDKVWVDFIGGDPRYPIVVGYRPDVLNNSTAWRRWEHENLEWLADKVANIIAGTNITARANQAITIDAGSTVVVKAPSVNVECTTATINASGSTSITSPSTTISGSLTVGGATTLSGGLSVSGGSSLGGGGTMTGNLRVNGAITASGTIKELS